jgi:hypothetical protein
MYTVRVHHIVMDTNSVKALPTNRNRTAIDTERALVERALDTLRDLGIEAQVDRAQGKDPRVDYTATLRRGARRAAFRIEAKRALRPGTLGPVLLRLKGLKPPALLLADYVTPQMANLLRDAGVAFADAAGNAYLEFGGNILYVTGNAPEQQPRHEKVVRAFQATGLRVVFALLCAPELVTRPTRELAAMLAVANGTVGRVIDDLAHLGFVTTAGKRDRRLHNLKDLLERWVMMYPVHLRPTLLRRRLTTDQRDWWKKEKFDPQHVVLGGEPAADRLTEYLKPGTVTLYARGEPRPLNEIVARHHLRTDPAGEVEVLDAFWPTEIAGEKPGLAPTPLIYADLLATGDTRRIETAKLIYDDYLARRFTQA